MFSLLLFSSPNAKGIVYGKPVHQGITQLKNNRSLRGIAEERVGRAVPNLRVLNSYWVNQDSTYKFFEIILVDPSHNAIRNDPRLNWLAKPEHKHRELRGLTRPGKKARGLSTKGPSFNKRRPSVAAPRSGIPLGFAVIANQYLSEEKFVIPVVQPGK